MHSSEVVATQNGFFVQDSAGSGASKVQVIDATGNFRPNSVFGNTWFVDYGAGVDTNSGKTAKSAFKLLSTAIAAATTNNNDVIYVRGNATVVETSMITLTKSRLTIVGVGGGGRYGLAAKIQFAGTGATNVATFQNLGTTRNTFVNLKFINGSAQTESKYAVIEAGEYAVYQNCEFYNSTHLDTTDAAEILLEGDSAQFFNCTVGSLADTRVGTVIRPNLLVQRDVIAGHVCRDTLFENCLFWIQASHTTSAFVHTVGATDVERLLLFKGCGFINNEASSATPAQAISCAASLTVGNIVLDPSCYAAKVTKVSTSTGVLTTGSAVSSGAGIAVNAA